MNAKSYALPSSSEQALLLDKAYSAQRQAVVLASKSTKHMDYDLSNHYLQVANNLRLVRSSLEHAPKNILMWKQLVKLLNACSWFKYVACVPDATSTRAIQGDPVPAPRLSCGLFFDGERGKYVQTPNVISDNGSEDFTVSAWFFQAQGAPGSLLTIVSVGQYGPCVARNYVEWALYVNQGQTFNQIRFSANDYVSGDNENWATTTDVQPSVWNHVSIVRTGGSSSPAIAIYINGVIANTYTQGTGLNSGTLWASQANASQSFVAIGAKPECDGNVRFPFAGIIADYLFHTRALSATEVQTLYAAGVNPDYGTLGSVLSHADGWPLNQKEGELVYDLLDRPSAQLQGYSDAEVQEGGGAWLCEPSNVCACSAHRYTTDLRSVLGSFNPTIYATGADGGTLGIDLYIEGDAATNQLPVLRMDGDGTNMQVWLEWNGSSAYDLFVRFEEGSENVLVKYDTPIPSGQWNRIAFYYENVSDIPSIMFAYLNGQSVGATEVSVTPIIDGIIPSYTSAILGTHSGYEIDAGFAIRLRNFTTYDGLGISVGNSIAAGFAADYTNAGYPNIDPCGSFVTPRPSIYYALGEFSGTAISGIDYRNGTTINGLRQRLGSSPGPVADYVSSAYLCEDLPQNPVLCNCLAHHYGKDMRSRVTLPSLIGGDSVLSVGFDVYLSDVVSQVGIGSLWYSFGTPNLASIIAINLTPATSHQLFIGSSITTGGNATSYNMLTDSTPIRNNTWHRVLVTWEPGTDGSYNYPLPKIYVDGVLVSASVITDPLDTDVPMNVEEFVLATIIGSYGLTMRNLCIYERTLNTNEVQQDWRASGYPEGIAPCKAEGYPSPDIHFNLGDAGDTVFAGTNNMTNPPSVITGTRDGGADYAQLNYDC